MTTTKKKSVTPNNKLLTALKAQKFYPTQRTCSRWYKIINVEVFDSTLDPCKITVRRLRGVWGYFDMIERELVITNWFPSKELFLNVISHEMVHIYQHSQGATDIHGRSFWQWKKKFRKNGLRLSVMYHGRYIVKHT